MDYYIFSPPKGQANKIARYLHEGFFARGRNAVCMDYVEMDYMHKVPCSVCFIVLSPVFYGQHLKEATKQVRSICAKNPSLPVVLLSVSLSARSLKLRHKSQQLDQWKSECRVAPILCEAIAGRLSPESFPWPIRTLLRLWFTYVLKQRDANQYVELTDWRQVDKIIETILR